MRALSDLLHALLPSQRYRPATVYSPDPELRERVAGFASLTGRHDIPFPLFTAAQRNAAAFTQPAPAVQFELRELADPKDPRSFYTVAFSPGHGAFLERLNAYATGVAGRRTLHLVVIFPPMGSGPYTRCIRRLVSRLQEGGGEGSRDEFLCCVLLPRQSKDSKLPCECSKHRNSFMNNEDAALLGEYLDRMAGAPREAARPGGVTLDFVGFSLGSMMLVRLLRNNDLIARLRALRKIRLGACCALYTTFDPVVHTKHSDAQQRSFGSFYLGILRNNMDYYAQHVPREQIEAAMRDGRLWVLDTKITAPMNDCASLEEYYGEMMPPGHLGEIDARIPLLFFCVRDDAAVGPIIETEAFAREGKRRVCVVQLDKGGHLGTVTRDGKDVCGQVVREWLEGSAAAEGAEAGP